MTSTGPVFMAGMLSCDVAFMLKMLDLEAHLFLIYSRHIYSTQNSSFSTVNTLITVIPVFVFCFP